MPEKKPNNKKPKKQAPKNPKKKKVVKKVVKKKTNKVTNKKRKEIKKAVDNIPELIAEQIRKGKETEKVSKKSVEIKKLPQINESYIAAEKEKKRFLLLGVSLTTLAIFILWIFHMTTLIGNVSTLKPFSSEIFSNTTDELKEVINSFEEEGTKKIETTSQAIKEEEIKDALRSVLTTKKDKNI
ncbi:MAG: hypothetical protein HOE80_01775 [Candidatus Magasanikbacteria bacterium]|jgi:hypothetical protein|nr:hypothetical protein [Candidatus Magasanikbacteria bacterium]MBT4071431.1 hypothetical protein [Candidatus Magasanikbacteria bacterium]